MSANKSKTTVKKKATKRVQPTAKKDPIVEGGSCCGPIPDTKTLTEFQLGERQAWQQAYEEIEKSPLGRLKQAKGEVDMWERRIDSLREELIESEQMLEWASANREAYKKICHAEINLL